MNEPFDWTKLAHAVYKIFNTRGESSTNAADYLRTRIEAAFVPKGTVRGTDFRLNVTLDWKARAEAAEARVQVLEAFRDHMTAEAERLTTQLAEAREIERAAVARAKEEGVRAGIEAAEQAVEDATDTDREDCCLDTSGDLQTAIRNLDPAAISSKVEER